MAVNGNIPVNRGVLPEGEAGVDETVSRMVRMAHSKYGTKSPKIRALAIDILNKAKVADKDYYGMIIAVHNWVRDKIRYIRDPLGQETISYPEETAFNSGAGDCDDKTILEIALLGSLGIQAWPVVYGRTPGRYSHVYLRAVVPPGRHRYANRVISLDPIMREWPAGREAKGGAKKEYRQFAQGTTTMDGLGMGMDAQGMLPGMAGGDFLPGMQGLGAYAQAPDYLPGDITTAEVKLMSGKDERNLQTLTTPVVPGAEMNADGSVANSNQVSTPPESIDGYFLPANPVGSGKVPVPGERYGPGPAQEQQIAAKYTRYGQLFNSMPTIYSAPKSRLSADGPMTAYQAKLRTRILPQVGATKLAPMKAGLVTQRRNGNGNGVRTRGPQHVIVNDRPMLPQDANGKAKQGRSKTPAQEAEELDGLANLVQMTAQSVELAGLGQDPNSMGKGLDVDTIDRVATLSWWADWKKSLMQAVREHATEVRKHIETLVQTGQQEPVQLVRAKEEEQAAKDLEKAAKEVAKQAQTVEKAVARHPAAKQRMASQKRALFKVEAEKGTPSAIDAVDNKKAAEINVDQTKAENNKAASMDGMGAVWTGCAAPPMNGLGEAVRRQRGAFQRLIDRVRAFWARYQPGDQARAAQEGGANGARAAEAKVEIMRREGRNEQAKQAAIAEHKATAGGVRSKAMDRRRRLPGVGRRRLPAPALQAAIQRLERMIPQVASVQKREEMEAELAQLKSELAAEQKSHRPDAWAGEPRFKQPQGLDPNLKRRDVALRQRPARRLATPKDRPAAVEGLGGMFGLTNTQLLVGGLALAGGIYFLTKKR